MLYCRTHLYQRIDNEVFYNPIPVTRKGKGCKFCEKELASWRDKRNKRKNIQRREYEEEN